VTWVRLTQVLVCDKSLSVGLCMLDYKSLCTEVTCCANMVNRHDTQTDSDYTIRSASQLMYEGRSINKLQNGIILLIFKI